MEHFWYKQIKLIMPFKALASISYKDTVKYRNFSGFFFKFVCLEFGSWIFVDSYICMHECIKIMVNPLFIQPHNLAYNVIRSCIYQN